MVHAGIKSQITSNKSQANQKFEYKKNDFGLVLIGVGGVAMSTGEGTKVYDLEERTFLFAKAVRSFLKRVPRTIGNEEDGRQLLRASGSVGANYIEANEGLSKKDFLMRVRVARKEAKESRFWLRLLDTSGADPGVETTRGERTQEATELLLILTAIIRKTSARD